MAEQIRPLRKENLTGQTPGKIIDRIQATLGKGRKARAEIPLVLDGILEIERQVKEARGSGIPSDSPASEYFTEVGLNPFVYTALLDREKRTRGEKARAENRRLREILGYPPRRELSRRTFLTTGAAAAGLLLTIPDQQASRRAALVASSSSVTGEQTSPAAPAKPVETSVTTLPTVEPPSPPEDPRQIMPRAQSSPTPDPSSAASPESSGPRRFNPSKPPPEAPTPPLPSPSPRTVEPRRVITKPKDSAEPKEAKLPPKEERIFHPAELSYEEVRPWIPKLRNTHDAVLTESLFTTELGGMNPEFRKKVLDAVAQAHAQALFDHYGDTDAIIGIDPGHGGSDVGSSSNGVVEQLITYKVANMVADKLSELSKGKYRMIILRPEKPDDKDLDRDGAISFVERIQKRKAQLVKMEADLRKDKPEDIGKNIAYVSIHFNGGTPGQHGAEVYYPNEVQMENQIYRAGSEKLAKGLQENILKSVRNLGYNLYDRKAQVDIDRNPPGSNSDTRTGGYLALGSKKLDRDLQRVT